MFGRHENSERNIEEFRDIIKEKMEEIQKEMDGCENCPEFGETKPCDECPVSLAAYYTCKKLLEIAAAWEHIEFGDDEMSNYFPNLHLVFDNMIFDNMMKGVK